jgi:hypothetical protein
METDVNAREQRLGWLEASGLTHILRTLGLAIHPPKLALAFAALLSTLILGLVLDAIWTSTNYGVQATAIENFVAARRLHQPHAETQGEYGVFRVFRDHERRHLLGFLGSSLPGASFVAGTPMGSYVEAHSQAGPLQNLIAMAHGVLWMMRHHPFYFLLFGLGTLIVFAWTGGAICRLAAVQFAKDEKLTLKQGLIYARGKLFGGFVLAPLIPVAFIVLIAVLLVLGGLLLRVPILGDLICGLAFGTAILGGFVIAILLVGMVIGGSLFWPTVAAEGSDAFDSFSRSLSYPLSRPWKALLYAVIAVVFASLCWVLVNLFAYLALAITRGVVGFGTAPFGWFSRANGGAPVRKLDLLWPLGGPNTLYAWPQWSQLAWYEYFSAFMIAVQVLLVIGLVWSFLCSFYFCASTVVYFLLRRDVDGTDLDEIQDEEETVRQLPPVTSAPTPSSTSVGKTP